MNHPAITLALAFTRRLADPCFVARRLSCLRYADPCEVFLDDPMQWSHPMACDDRLDAVDVLAACWCRHAREPRTRGHATDADGALCGRGGRGLSEACYVLKWSPFVFGTRVREFRARAVGAVVWTSVDVCVRG